MTDEARRELRPEEVAAIQGREGHESADSVAKRYRIARNTVVAIWHGFVVSDDVMEYRRDDEDDHVEETEETVEIPNTPKARIRRRLDTLDKTYRDIADEIGVTKSAVSHIVNGNTTSATARYSLARALDCWPEDLWWDDYHVDF